MCQCGAWRHCKRGIDGSGSKPSTAGIIAILPRLSDLVMRFGRWPSKDEGRNEYTGHSQMFSKLNGKIDSMDLCIAVVKRSPSDINCLWMLLTCR